MAYKIFMTIDAAEELEKIIQYLIEKKEESTGCGKFIK